MKMNSKRATRSQTNILLRGKFGNLIYSDPNFHSIEDDDYQTQTSSVNPSYHHDDDSTPPYNMSPLHPGSPFAKSPWITTTTSTVDRLPETGLIASLIREEGHIYSLAASGDLLYTGSDSKNIRVWKNQEEFSGFKSGSGLVKAIVISGNKIFTGHQDGKIRIWKVSSKDSTLHKRVGTLPKVRDMIKSSIKPSNYVQVRRHRNALWIKHFDVISCLSSNEEQGLLYSGSWDKTIKVWRISDSKCLESINAHDDAVNSVVSGFDGLVFTGSADGTVKVWRRESLQGNGTTKHLHVETLLNQDSAVTALAVNSTGSVIYSGSSDGVVNFWEREKHLSHGGTLRGHKQAVLCLAAKGNLVFSGSADKSICVWRREGHNHTCLSVLTGHNGPIKCLAVERDDEESTAEDERWILYSGSLDKAVKVWKISGRGSGIDAMDEVLQKQQPTSFSYPNY